MRVLVTGASGFIGSHFVRHLLCHTDYRILALVRNSSQRNLRRLYDDNIPEVAVAEDNGLLHVVYGDLLGDLSGLCEGIDWVVHFAAKTFVDHSIRDPLPFAEANFLGTARLLEEARRNQVKKFIAVGTDEVYGAILQGAYTETAPLRPTNVYAASKAGADCLAISYAHTYGLNTLVTRTENNFGKRQHPQKVFPVFTRMAMRDQPLPVYGDGLHVRQWLHVSDHVLGILHLLQADTQPGDIYHIAGNQELTNLELAHRILDALGKPHSLIRHIDDHDIRPGHDRRYALDCSKLRALGWTPQTELSAGIADTVAWYARNSWWTEA